MFVTGTAGTIQFVAKSLKSEDRCSLVMLSPARRVWLFNRGGVLWQGSRELSITRGKLNWCINRTSLKSGSSQGS